MIVPPLAVIVFGIGIWLARGVSIAAGPQTFCLLGPSPLPAASTKRRLTAQPEEFGSSPIEGLRQKGTHSRRKIALAGGRAWRCCRCIWRCVLGDGNDSLGSGLAHPESTRRRAVTVTFP